MNLMIGFGIDEIQAEYVAEIKLRHLNREYILKRTDETQSLKEEIAQMEEILGDQKKVRGIIVSELQEIKKKYAQPRRSLILYDVQPAPGRGGGRNARLPGTPVFYPGRVL